MIVAAAHVTPAQTLLQLFDGHVPIYQLESRLRAERHSARSRLPRSGSSPAMRLQNIDGRGDAFDFAVFIGDHRQVGAERWN